MKELSIEEKAKAYDEAIEALRSLFAEQAVKHYDRVNIKDITNIFSELKESEDERIMKDIVEAVELHKDFTQGRKEHIYAWLEAQGKQKQHLELKAGKWYICYRAYCCRADNLTVREGERFMCEKDGIVKGFMIKEPEKYFRECSAPAPMEDEQKTTENEELTEFDKAVGVSIGTWNPKTPEQIKSVKAVSKKLLKLAKKQINDEYRSAWSEEDRRTIDNLISQLGNLFARKLIKEETKDKYINWLKSLRPQNRWKPSDVQIVVIDDIIRNGHLSNANERIMCELLEQLKKLKDEK